MLGRMKMDVDTCIQNYLRLAPEIFAQRKPFWDKFSKVNDLLTVRPRNRRARYIAEKVESGFKRVANEGGMDEEALLLDFSGACKV